MRTSHTPAVRNARAPATSKKSGPVMAQKNVRLKAKLARQVTPTAPKSSAVEYGWSAGTTCSTRSKAPHKTRNTGKPIAREVGQHIALV